MEMERLANGEILTFSGKVLKLTSGNVRTVILSGSGKMGRRCQKMPENCGWSWYRDSVCTMRSSKLEM
jgi:hypothetical protein